ncbi:MAG: glycosyltransferase [Oscillatoria princeps RMCB-10]|nr:glycosyltransferase [Oscillatoria princeps RMCB-10]
MHSSHTPQMSVIIATPDTFKTIQKTLSYLRAQTVKEQLEIVIVAPSKDQLGLDESELQDFFKFQVVEVGPIPSVAFANAAGVRHASAPVVAFAETHAFPNPEWAEALIEAHKQPRAAVGPAMVNGNPDSAISWASFLIAYSRWMEPVEAGTIEDLPGHNSCYKREILLEKYGDKLDTLLETESILHWDLRSSGYELYLEPRAKTQHLNPTLPASFLGELFYYGRLFAAARAQHWSFFRRLVYTVSSPLIPLVRIRHTLPNVRRAKQHYKLPRFVWPPIIAGLIAASVGEMLGYALGAGNAMEQMKEYEYHRERHLAERDRPAAAS